MIADFINNKRTYIDDEHIAFEQRKEKQLHAFSEGCKFFKNQ